MTIAETSLQTRNSYTGNGSTTVFSFTFIVLEESNQALNRDYTIKVILTENNIETIQQEGTDYTVQLGTDGLGTVTFTTAPTSTQSITFLSEIPRTQSTDYVNIGTDKFPANSHEGTVDKLTLISREQDEFINRSILLSASSTLTNIAIPVTTENANKAIVVNSDGNNLTAKSLADIGAAAVTDFAKTLLDDNNSNEARTTLDAQQDVITTEGDLIKGNSSGEAERLPVGTAGQILQSNGTNPVYAPFAGKNVIINGNFAINQRVVSGTVTLLAGEYGHDRWKAGSSGCTYTFATSNNVTTITITAGSLIQTIEGLNLFDGTYTLSWTGTSQGKIGAGSFGNSGINGVITGGSNLNIEFNTGTISLVQLEAGSVATEFEKRSIQQEENLSYRYYETGLTGFSGETGGSNLVYNQNFKVSKRALASMSVTLQNVTNISTITTGAGVSVNSFQINIAPSGSGFIRHYDSSWIANAEL